jgi:maltose O-acetyltransferase
VHYLCGTLYFVGGRGMDMRQFVRKMAYRLMGRPTIDELVTRGLKIGSNCFIQDDVEIDDSHCWHITIGNNVGIGPSVKILAHDGCMKAYLGYTRIGKVTIEDGVFIGAGTIILPGVTIGANTIVGAGSVITRDIPANVVAAGNPVKVIAKLEDFLASQRERMRRYPCFEREYTIMANVSTEKKEEMNRLMVDGQGYVV